MCLPVGLKSDNSHGAGHDLSLSVGVGEGDSLEDLDTLQGVLSSLGLAGNHSFDGSPDDSRGGSEVVGTSVAGVGVRDFVQELEEVVSTGEEQTTHHGLFGSHDDNSLSVEHFFGHKSSESSHKMALSVDDYFFVEHDELYIS